MEFESPRFAGDALLHAILNDPDTGTVKLGPGSPPSSVKRLQQALWDLHWVSASSPGTTLGDFVIGIYGPKTKTAVTGYKSNYNIHFPPDAPTGFIDSFAGPRTFRRLDRHCAQFDRAVLGLFTRFEQLQAAGVPISLPPNPNPDESHTVWIADTTGAFWLVALGGGTFGHLYFREQVGAFLVSGPIEESYWNEAGGPAGFLGFPTSDVFSDAAGDPTNEFEGGSISQNLQTGVVSITPNGVTVDHGDPFSRF
jgi:hypothetical protein